MTKKRPENYKSKLIDALLNEISPAELKRTERKMMLAARIQDALKAKNMKKGEFAKALNKLPSEISKWLSGTHNFTSETLWDIGDVLEINLINIKEEQKVQIVYNASTSVIQTVESPVDFPHPYCNIIDSIRGYGQKLSKYKYDN
jgi:transcriptional regulator with XRE-family HTH domain